jgi:hypothetical protein
MAEDRVHGEPLSGNSLVTGNKTEKILVFHSDAAAEKAVSYWIYGGSHASVRSGAAFGTGKLDWAIRE